MKSYAFTLKFTEPILGSAPSNAEVYKQYISNLVSKEKSDEEASTLGAEEKERIGWDIFHRDETGLLLYDYHVRGFLKEAASAVTGKGEVTAYRSKIDKWVFVSPRRMYFKNEVGEVIKSPDGVLERAVRAMTMQGPRVTLKRSDKLEAGCRISGKVTVLDLGEKEFTEERVLRWFEYGAFSGLGEWRTGSYGRFVVEEWIL